MNLLKSLLTVCFYFIQFARTSVTSIMMCMPGWWMAINDFRSSVTGHKQIWPLISYRVKQIFIWEWLKQVDHWHCCQDWIYTFNSMLWETIPQKIKYKVLQRAHVQCLNVKLISGFCGFCWNKVQAPVLLPKFLALVLQHIN